ncbi:N-acetyl-L,L-diaminopimelate aminotransferase [Bhargavaea cecembensis]|uniref:Aminotransferase n=1 Tax=Bhargavaea cecembensis TaxID=394098 RepID=A0A165H5K1_9BACL|nr:aminotransferase class I/II-fold pyridoxal phosphate-dependent enzyme [Bhargavaea cecembensis]KZE38838.1 N-acetyl-L,L-diaminopimelate aminotransferase [Bhargavaea cecembensis]
MNSLITQINENAAGISIPGIRVFANKVNLLPDGINLTIGEPDFPTPEPIKQAAVAAITNNLTGYSHNAGLLSLRKSVSRHFHQSYGFAYDPEHEILITNGASSGIDAALRTILREGDEVILPAPIYSGYDPVIRLAGGVPVYLDTSDTGFKPDPVRLEALVTLRTKAVILNYPSNPTGATLDRDTTDRLADVLSRHDLFVISDEIYSENVYSGPHISLASYPSLRNQLILIHGLSKSHSMTGWRVGFVLAPRFLTEQILKVHMSNSICASLPSQYAAIEALETCRDIPKEMNKAYIRRRDYAHRRLTEMGLDVELPTGAFYLFPSITRTRLGSWEFAEKLLDSQHVAVVPGGSFTSYGEGFIRISYATSMDTLVKGLDRMETFLHELQP